MHSRPLYTNLAKNYIVEMYNLGPQLIWKRAAFTSSIYTYFPLCLFSAHKSIKDAQYVSTLCNVYTVFGFVGGHLCSVVCIDKQKKAQDKLGGHKGTRTRIHIHKQLNEMN